MQKEIFDAAKINFGPGGEFDRTGLVKGLVRIASDFDERDGVDYELRAHALAIAGRIDASSEAFRETERQLREDALTFGSEATTKSRLLGNIRTGVRALLHDQSNTANRTCAAYCTSLALRFDPKSRYADYFKEIRDNLETAGIKADWSGLLDEPVTTTQPPGMFPPQDRMKPRRETIPGGSAPEIAARQRSIHSLIVSILDGGKYAGTASEITATALPEKDVAGVELRIDQNVGDMMSNSLRSIRDLLRVTYDSQNRIPDGYAVNIVFEDRDAMIDGASAGTAMALALDALFSGRELDPSFACTGGITPGGKVTKVGGVAAKIRGATRRHCRIVGIPEGNARSANDLLVLKGLNPLLDVQIFTLHDLDQARTLAHKDKDPVTTATLANFNLVANTIHEKGPELLQNSHVHDKLEEIVEAMPNHMSARLLLEIARGRDHEKLSAGGSFHEIDTTVSAVFEPALAMLWHQNYTHSRNLADDARETAASLESLGDLIDPRFDDYLQAALGLCRLLEQGRGDDDEITFLRRLHTRWEILLKERQDLSKDPEVREEMMG
jgi:hypothetical protein